MKYVLEKDGAIRKALMISKFQREMAPKQNSLQPVYFNTNINNIEGFYNCARNEEIFNNFPS